jgi:predicted DsbA family dithiol-disulfide isomerase
MTPWIPGTLREGLQLAERVDVYFDYACPWAWGGQVWLDQVRDELGDELEISWKYFPLQQVNAKDPEFRLWEQANDLDEAQNSSLRSFQAAHAAAQQGEEAFGKFHAALFRKRHVDGRNLGKQDVLESAAEEAGLDLGKFREDLATMAANPVIEEHYTQARELGVFGTPTIMFENGEGAYLQVNFRNLPKDPVTFWQEFVQTVRDRPEVREIKRPQRPRK